MLRITTLIFLIVLMLLITVSCFSKEGQPSEAEKHAAQGLTLANGGDFEGAKAELKKAIELDPDNKDFQEALVIVYIKAGNFYFQQGRVEDAIKEFEAALKKKPDNADLNYNLGVIYHNKNDLEKAKTYYLKCLELKPAKEVAQEVNCYLGNLYVAQKNYEKARVYYNKYIELAPEGNFAGAVYMQLGNMYFEEKNYEKAAGCYKSVIKLKDINLMNGHYNLGMCYLETGKLDDAEKEFLEAKKLSPATAVIYGQLGKLYMKKKDYAKAIENYNQAISYDSSNYEFHLELGKACEETGDLAGAIDSYNKAISLNPAVAEVHYLLGSLYYEQKNYEKSVEELKKAVELDPQNKLYKETLTAVEPKIAEMESQKNTVRFVDSTIDTVYIDGEKIEENLCNVYAGTEYDLEIVYKDGTVLSGTLKMLESDRTLEKGYKFGKISQEDRENARMGGSGTIYLVGSDGSKDVEIIWEGSIQ